MDAKPDCEAHAILVFGFAHHDHDDHYVHAPSVSHS